MSFVQETVMSAHGSCQVKSQELLSPSFSFCGCSFAMAGSSSMSFHTCLKCDFRRFSNLWH